MDRRLEPTIDEKIKIRKAMFPMLQELLKNITVNDNRNISFDLPLNVINALKSAFNEAILNIKMPNSMQVSGKVDVKFPEVQKVEVTNQKEIVFPEINVVEKVINFPELQNIKGEVIATNLPTGKDKEANSKSANPSEYLIVRLSDGQKFIDNIGGATSVSSSRQGDHLFLREEYSYMTVSGNTVPYKIEKYSDNIKLTETYEYDGNGNPIRKFRSLEPYNG